MYRSVKSLGQEVSSILGPRDMRSADQLGPNEIKCHLISICLDWLWKMGLSDRATSPVLSVYMSVGSLRSSVVLGTVVSAKWPLDT